jgi:hypothetical protein
LLAFTNTKIGDDGITVVSHLDARRVPCHVTSERDAVQAISDIVTIWEEVALSLATHRN